MQQKSHETLIKILNNVGIIGAVLCSIADIVVVLIFVFGVNINADMKSSILFSVINAIVGVMINVLLRFQGQKYAEIENEELLQKYHALKAIEKKDKKHLPMSAWQAIKTVEDIIIKGGTTVFGIYGIIYISIEGSKNPIQILITIITLILFLCFGLINLNSGYYRFYNIQVPYMEQKIKEK